MATFTPDDKKAYFAELRAKFANAKAQSERYKNRYAQACELIGRQPSITNFTLILLELENTNYKDYTPYVDICTFNEWKARGFKVTNGQTALSHGITWLEIKDKEGKEKENKTLIPKTFAVFGKHQVESI